MCNTLKTVGIALVAIFGFTLAGFASSPHFIFDFDTLNATNGDDCVSFKEAGLGNTPITYTITVDNAVFTFQCFTRHDNEPQGAPNNVSFSNLTASTTIQPHNGQITGELCLEPLQGDAGCQGGGLELRLIHVLYEGVHFCDTTDNICVDFGTFEEDLNVSFGRGNGH